MTLPKINSLKKSGNETIVSGGSDHGSLMDFWSWGFSNLLDNDTRNLFAVYIVHHALGIQNRPTRNNDFEYDIITDDNRIKVDIFSDAYIHVWEQEKPKDIIFSIKPQSAAASRRQADIYVFAILKHKDQETINPLNLDQWEFYVIGIDRIKKLEKSILRLDDLNKITVPVGYMELKDSIYKTYCL